MADKLHTFNSISEYHKFRGLPAPEHPLISVSYCISNSSDALLSKDSFQSLSCNFYTIILKRNSNGKLKYGHHEYDFNEGIMLFFAAGQVFGIESVLNEKPDGWVLMIHPDFLAKTHLTSTIHQYEYFGYAVHEALFLSKKEEVSMINIFKSIQLEYCNNIDNYSKNIIIAHLELLLSYSERYYNRQFITRSIVNHQILSKLEVILNNYFSTGSLINIGLPNVQEIAEKLNLSPNYLSGLLKNLTGMSTQQHIHSKLIERAKEKLSSTVLTVSEIAYQLGFEHPQSFSKLFKSKTNLSPLEFRQSFN